MPLVGWIRTHCAAGEVSRRVEDRLDTPMLERMSQGRSAHTVVVVHSGGQGTCETVAAHA